MKGSAITKTTTYASGFAYMILPDATSETGYKSYMLNLSTVFGLFAKLDGGTFTGNVQINGSLTGLMGAKLAITAKNGTELPSTYPDGISYFAYSTGQTGWPYTSGSVINYKYASGRHYQFVMNVNSPHDFQYRHRNSGTDAWEGWKSFSTTLINQYTSASSLNITDNKKIIELNASSAFNFTLGQMYAGFTADIIQMNTGVVTLVAGSGVALRYKNTNRKLATQYEGVSIYYRSATECVIVGNLSA